MKTLLKYKRSPADSNSSPVFKGLLLLYAACTTAAIFLLVGSIETITQDNQVEMSASKISTPIDTKQSNFGSEASTSSSKLTPQISHLHLFQAHSQAPFIVRTVALLDASLLGMEQELNLINDIVRKTKIPSRMANPPFIPIRSIFRKQDALIVDFHPDMMSLVNGKTVAHIQNTYVLVHSLLEFSQMRKMIFLFDGGRAIPSNSNINFEQGLIVNPQIVKGAES